MADRPVESLTLREKLIDAEKLARELVEHLERGFIPKVHQLRRTSRRATNPDHQGEIRDLTIRNSVDQVLKSDDYTRQLADRATTLLNAIDTDVQTIFEQGSTAQD